MAEVYLAQHPRLPRRDALKVLSESVTADSNFRERFHREADLAGARWHPNIVAVHDRGEFDGQAPSGSSVKFWTNRLQSNCLSGRHSTPS
jgi:serine/threonine protein kinase